MHTSTVTVAVMDKFAQAVTINDSDIKIEWFSGTGAGGQHRNKHQNSCRLTHIPTGTVAVAQCRSRQNSYNEAKQELIDRVTQQHKTVKYAEQASVRKDQVGSGMRGDKIRTYRFQDDMVKDHLTGKSANLTKVLRGYFDMLWR